APEQELLEDVREVRLHGRLGDREPARDFAVAQTAGGETHDLLLALAQAAADRRLDLRAEPARGQILDDEREDSLARPYLALVDDPDRLEQGLHGGALAEDAARARLQGLEDPRVVDFGARQDHVRPRAVAAKLAADRERARGLRVHQQDVRRARPHQRAHRRRASFSHQRDRAVALQDPPETGTEETAVAQDR